MIGTLARGGVLAGILLCAGAGVAAAIEQTPPPSWEQEWKGTDFTASIVPFHEILSGGPPKDGIPAIDNPEFIPAGEAGTSLHDAEPVLTLLYRGVARAYPLRYLMWHEIVNDVVGGEPVSVTYCPLCNSALAFKGTFRGQHLTFGVSGKLRNSDMIMYDRQTESWWQQFEGRAIVGEFAKTDSVLETIPVALESWRAFKERSVPGMEVLFVGGSWSRPYGKNPYEGYDSLSRPWLYQGDLSELSDLGVRPLDRVVRVGNQAWPLKRVLEEGVIRESGLAVSWTGQTHASALDSAVIPEGRQIPSVNVVDESGNPVAHEVIFAFVFHAFEPNGNWNLGGDAGPAQGTEAASAE